MKLDYKSSSLVILGGWNPNIFTPTWFDKYFPSPQDVDNPQDTNLKITPGQVLSIKHAYINISLNNGVIITFTEAQGKLEFKLNEKIKDFHLLEQTALKLFKHLSTTIVVGYGVNFVFKSNNIDQKTIDVIHKNGIMQNKYFNNQIEFENYLFKTHIDNINTNIGIDVNNIENNCIFRFNFHFDIDGLSNFELSTNNNPIDQLKQKAIKVMFDTYKLDVEI